MNNCEDVNFCRGVYFNKASKKWKAHIYINSVELHLGTFSSYEDAVESRICAEKNYENAHLYRTKNDIVNSYQESDGKCIKTIYSIDISGPSREKEEMLIDKSSWEYLEELGVGRITKAPSGYANARISGKTVLIHKMLMVEAIIVDHINRNRLDNRMSNLRYVTTSQNSMNSGLRKNNKSGVRGVCWNEHAGKWCVQIGINGCYSYFGLFSNIEDAKEVRERLEIDLYGEYSPLYGDKNNG